VEYILVILSVMLINNFVLAKFLGLCPFIGVTKNTRDALGMGIAVTFVMALTSVVCWVIRAYLLIPSESNILYIIAKIFDPAVDWHNFNFVDILQTLIYILVIAALVQFVEFVIRKVSPPLYTALGIYLPLITTNCAVLGVALLNSDYFFKNSPAGISEPVPGSFFLSLVNGIGGGLGFVLVMLLMSGVREHLMNIPVPRAFRGVPIAIICTGCFALAFMGFAGML
jgi:Na+-translocating ferredoxin:NAD+ oxidoreductase subunit A